MELNEKIKQCEIFQSIEDNFINQIIENSQIVQKSPTEIIFHEEEDGTYLYILLSGKVEIFKSSEDAKEIVINTLTAGMSFAEVIIYEKSKYPVTARCLVKCELLKINRDIIIKLTDNKIFREQFIKSLFQKMRHLAERVQYLTTIDVEERFLIFLKTRYGKSNKYSLDISKKEVAREIGTIPETFSRMLKKLAEKNIKCEGSQIILPDNFWDKY